MFVARFLQAQWNRTIRPEWLLAVIAFIVIGCGLGMRDPHPADEPRFALVAKQMVESGQWLFPHRGHELYSDKPPMLMWLQALAFCLLHNWKIAFLLPSFIASLGTLACVYDLGQRLWTRQVGRCAAYCLLITFHFTYQAKRAQIDALLVFFVTLANYGLLRFWLCDRRWRWWVLGWFAAGLGTITKGVGFLALLMILPALITKRGGWLPITENSDQQKPWCRWLGPLAFLTAAAIWLVPMLMGVWLQATPEMKIYVRDILFHQTAQRYAHSWDHSHSWYYFMGVMASMWWPALLALPWAVPAWIRRLRRHDPRYFIPLAWWIIVIIFFSIPSGKRDVYILPALPMVCLMLGPLLPGILKRKSAQRLLLAFIVIVLVITTVIAAQLLSVHGAQLGMIQDRQLDGSTQQWLGWTCLMIVVWGLTISAIWARRSPATVMIGVMFGFWLAVGLVFFPAINPSSSARGLMENVNLRLGPNAELGLVAWKEQNLLMAGRSAETFGFSAPWHVQLQKAITWQAQSPAQRWLLVQEPAMLSCIDRQASIMIGRSNRRRWWLVHAEAVHKPCQVTDHDLQNLRNDQDSQN